MILSGRAGALLALGVLPLVLAPAWLTLAGWTGLVLVLSAADAALAVAPRRIEIRRQLAASVRLTEQAESVLTLTNSGRRAARCVIRDAWPPSAGVMDVVRLSRSGRGRSKRWAGDRHRLGLPAGQSRRVTTTLRPRRRGDRAADAVTIRSFGPLGLAGRQGSFPVPGQIRVLPEFRSRKHLPHRLALLREMDGRAAVQVRGQGTEFDSLRDYAIGDDVRSIDWRATARAETVMVRTWRPERDRRVLIVVDCSRWSAGRLGDATRLDAAIEASLLLGALASAGGDRVELLAFDRTIRAQSAPSAGGQTLAVLADALAGVESALLEADWTAIAAQVRRRAPQRALVVLLTGTDPAMVEVGLATVIGPLARRHAVLVATVRDPEAQAMRQDRDDSDAVYRAGAAERAELELAAMERILRQRGAHVVAAGPDRLAPAVADAYLELKRSGQL